MWTKQLRGIRSRPENQWSSEEKSSPRRVRERLSVLLGSNTLMWTLS